MLLALGLLVACADWSGVPDEVAPPDGFIPPPHCPLATYHIAEYPDGTVETTTSLFVERHDLGPEDAHRAVVVRCGPPESAPLCPEGAACRGRLRLPVECTTSASVDVYLGHLAASCGELVRVEGPDGAVTEIDRVWQSVEIRLSDVR